MDNLKKNYKLIIICFVLILITSLYLFKDRVFINDKENYYVDDYILKYDANQYMPVIIKEEDIVNLYFNEYKNNMLFDKKNAFKSLNKDYREIKFGTFDKYVEYLNNNIGDSTYDATIVKYNVNSVGGKKVFGCVDNSGFKYYFKENSIMNYEVYLDDYTVEIK